MKPHFKAFCSAVYSIQCTECMYIPLMFHTCTVWLVHTFHNNNIVQNKLFKGNIKQFPENVQL